MPSLLACLQVNHEAIQEAAQVGKKRKKIKKRHKKKSKKKSVVRTTASLSEKHAGRVGAGSSGKGSLLGGDRSSSLSLLGGDSQKPKVSELQVEHIPQRSLPCLDSEAYDDFGNLVTRPDHSLLSLKRNNRQEQAERSDMKVDVVSSSKTRVKKTSKKGARKNQHGNKLQTPDVDDGTSDNAESEAVAELQKPEKKTSLDVDNDDGSSDNAESEAVAELQKPENKISLDVDDGISNNAESEAVAELQKPEKYASLDIDKGSSDKAESEAVSTRKRNSRTGTSRQIVSQTLVKMSQKKPRIFTRNRTTRVRYDMTRSTGDASSCNFSMPSGGRPAGAYEWDMERGRWLNNDGSVYIEQPKSKDERPSDAVGWDTVRGVWIRKGIFSENIRRQESHARRRKRRRHASEPLQSHSDQSSSRSSSSSLSSSFLSSSVHSKSDSRPDVAMGKSCLKKTSDPVQISKKCTKRKMPKLVDTGPIKSGAADNKPRVYALMHNAEVEVHSSWLYMGSEGNKLSDGHSSESNCSDAAMHGDNEHCSNAPISPPTIWRPQSKAVDDTELAVYLDARRIFSQRSPRENTHWSKSVAASQVLVPSPPSFP